MKNLKLNKLEEQNLAERQMNVVKGGGCQNCGCSCSYEGNGGSSRNDNGAANKAHGLKSPTGEWTYIYVCSADMTIILGE
jgi:natural product precursor